MTKEIKELKIDYPDHNMYGIVQFHDEKKIIQVIGHFDGMICGLLTSIKIFRMVPFWNGLVHMEDGTQQDITSYNFKTKKQYKLFKRRIIEYIEKYNK